MIIKLRRVFFFLETFKNDFLWSAAVEKPYRRHRSAGAHYRTVRPAAVQTDRWRPVGGAQTDVGTRICDRPVVIVRV